jgi:hypothetical protein
LKREKTNHSWLMDIRKLTKGKSWQHW